MANDRVIETAHNQRLELKRLNAENSMLRRMLHSACIEFCHDCPSCGKDDCELKQGDCFVQEWRVAVGMNGGVRCPATTS